MLLVETYLAESPGKGIGLFSKNFIPKGTTIWLFREGFDIKVNAHKVAYLTSVEKEFVEKYFWTEGDYYYSCCDHAMFQNHSDNPNCTNLNKGTVITTRDVEAGEELTAHYSSFDDSYNEYKDKLI